MSRLDGGVAVGYDQDEASLLARLNELGEIGKVLESPGWSALQQIWAEDREDLVRALASPKTEDYKVGPLRGQLRAYEDLQNVQQRVVNRANELKEELAAIRQARHELEREVLHKEK